MLSSDAGVKGLGPPVGCRPDSVPAAGHRVLKTLCNQYLAERDPHWEGILKGGVYHLHKKLGVNESVMWGEYFFLEALDAALS